MIHLSKSYSFYCSVSISRTVEDWLYLAAIPDLYFRKIAGWVMGDRVKKEPVIRALEMALYRRNPGSGLICHSDRGSRYASYKYQDILKTNGVTPSMSRKGNCRDNAQQWRVSFTPLKSN